MTGKQDPDSGLVRKSLFEIPLFFPFWTTEAPLFLRPLTGSRKTRGDAGRSPPRLQRGICWISLFSSICPIRM